MKILVLNSPKLNIFKYLNIIILGIIIIKIKIYIFFLLLIYKS
jgi:hypothetical protein